MKLMKILCKHILIFIVSISSGYRNESAMSFFTENITECFTHAQTVCTRPLLGEEGRLIRH